MKFFAAVALALVAATGASAQTAQPYAGLQARAVKTLSPAQIEELRAGRGMGLALAAELNGYPGPVHVLELAEKLSLSPDQRQGTQALIAAMKAESIPLGEKLIEQEADLNRLFASRTVTPASLTAAMETIGSTQTALRIAHLKYHLATLELLTPGQAELYSQLRGYQESAPSHRHLHGN